MKKILIINTVPFTMGGISSVIINYLKNMNKEGMEITIIVNSKIEDTYKKFFYDNKIKIVNLERKKNIIKYIYELHKILKNNKFDVVHIHGNSSTMAFESIPAYLNKIEKIIVHAHSVSCDYKITNKILKPILKKTYTLAFACSKEAGNWLFGKNEEFLVLNNSIDLKKYKFNSITRSEIRRELNIDDNYVIGHVGYFNEDKNHKKIFEVVKYLKEKINVKLLCIAGNSEIPYRIKEMIKEYGIEDNVKILLRRDDVNKLLQGIDLFIFPSKSEGLGVAIVEAQATGVKCLASENISNIAIPCKSLVHTMSLATDSNEWGDFILNTEKVNDELRKNMCVKAINELKKSGYDISLEVEKLRRIYIN
ncbi:glycosyltransferase [Clostridium sp. Sa3CUN1]|uniref:Glycosyltransferase n=1 Tax=Clostridium gallinarum TaxID=2762246 RepID=A0ABR8Q7S8_9CLOT|nr:glycosyltransferase [Clostridium gallinarum]MBD7916454.1 glycosyltransferase [Clostridium gallinarum]